MVTTIGFLGNVAAAAMFVMAGIGGQSAGVAYDWFLWGGVVLILFSLFDMLDGQVARLGGMASTFGAMYDSVLDRYSELVTLGGLCYAMMQTGYGAGALITFVALIGSIRVSYVRARCRRSRHRVQGRLHAASRARGAHCSVDPCRRHLRRIKCPDPAFEPMWIIIVAMGVIAVFANLTAFARIFHSRRELEKKEQSQS